MTSTALSTYAQNKGYDVLTSIAPKEGFWVNASAVVTLTSSAASGVMLAESDLQQGWNLVGSADNKTPSQLNQGLSSSLSSAGKLITTAWAWDAPNKNWKFFAPSLEASGGLTNYITTKGYLPFSTTLSASDGFWLNIGAASLPSAVPTVTGMSTSTGAVGASVTIMGTNFDATLANNSVKFNGIAATVTAATATSLTVTVPSSATSGTVSVATAGGTATSAGSFTVSTGGTTPVSSARIQMGGAIQFTPTNPVAFDPAIAGYAASYDGLGPAAGIYFTSGITTDGTNLYIGAYQQIRMFNIASGMVRTLAGRPAGSFGSVDGAASMASFTNIFAITTDGTNIYVADEIKIRKVSIATGNVTTLAGSWAAGAADGIGNAASFSNLRGITTDGINLYVSDYENKKIRKIVIATGVVTTLPGTFGRGFRGPLGITTDGINLYVASPDDLDIGYVISKINIATGAVTILAGGNPIANIINYNGTGTAAYFDNTYTTGLSTDGINLYVASGTVRKVVISTGVVTTVAGGVFGSSITDGPASTAVVGTPRDVTYDGHNLYITDGDSIRKIDATGLVSTPAGRQPVAPVVAQLNTELCSVIPTTYLCASHPGDVLVTLSTTGWILSINGVATSTAAAAELAKYGVGSGTSGGTTGGTTGSSGGAVDCSTAWTGDPADIQVSTLCMTACSYQQAGSTSAKDSTCTILGSSYGSSATNSCSTCSSVSTPSTTTTNSICFAGTPATQDRTFYNLCSNRADGGCAQGSGNCTCNGPTLYGECPANFCRYSAAYSSMSACQSRL